MRLNKRSPIPPYYQLAELLRERIRTGELVPGDQLPSERELAEQAGISRMTVRQAVVYLVRDGALEVKPGIGTFVAEPKLTYDALHLLGFTEAVMRQGEVATSQVLEQKRVTPPTRVAAVLNLSTNEQVIQIVRLRLSGEVPLLLETIYLPASLCPGLEAVDLTKQSLYTLLEQQFNLHLSHARQTLEATIANDYESTLFDIEPDTPMILLEGITFDIEEQPVEYFKVVYRGDRIKLELDSQRHSDEETASSMPRLNILLETGRQF
jgi:GntR family transcriptional regulator